MPWPEPAPVARLRPADTDPRAWVRWSRPVLVRVVHGLARVVLAARRPVVITVTGSHGKTTTRENTAAVLRERWPDLRVTYRNSNSDMGAPLALLGERAGPPLLVLGRALRGAARGLAPWRPFPRAVVLEVTAKRPGDLRRLTAWLRPHVAVLTNVRDAHVGHYPSWEALAGEKCFPLRRLRPGGIAVLNAADRLTPRVAPLVAGEVLTFGGGDASTVHAEDVRSREGWTSATVVCGDERFDVRVPLWAPHQLPSLLAGVAVGLACGVPPARAVAAASGVASLPGRGAVSRSPDGLWVVDESGNASPQSMCNALAALRDTLPGPHVAVLSGMYELGEIHLSGHHAVGAALAGWLHHLIAVGSGARAIADGALAAGMPAERITYVRDNAEAAALARSTLRAPGSVLVKGTTYLDSVVRELTGAATWTSHQRPARPVTA